MEGRTIMTDFPHAKRPCSECPWRRDVEPGQFPAERFVALARTAYDMARHTFACHKSPEGREFACAGFLARGAEHNLSVRLALMGRDLARDHDYSGGLDLVDGYREMAERNGVDPEDPALGPCRS